MTVFECMRILGHEPNEGGMCAGFASAALLAIILGTYKEHRNILEKIKRLPPETSVKEISQDIQNLLRNIAIFYHPSKYEKLFPNQAIIIQHNYELTATVVQGKSVKEEDRMREVFSFSGVYNFKEMAQYLSSYLRVMEENGEAHFALLLSNYDHTILVNYNADEDSWIIDSNGENIKFPKNKIIELIWAIKASFGEFNSFLSTQIYSTQGCLAKTNGAMKAWRASKEWEEIHVITPEKAKATGLGNSSWFYQATKFNHSQILQPLLNAGANINIRSAKGFTPIHFAMTNNDLKTVQLLLDNQANIEAYTATGVTSLYLAAQNGNLKMITLLLDYKANIDAPTNDDDRYTPLHVAAQNGHFEVVELLLRKGASINMQTAKGYTPLSLAVQFGREKIAKLLIQSILSKNPATSKPPFLSKALSQFWDEKISLNRKEGQHNNSNRPNDLISLHLAVQNEDLETVSQLLKNGTEIEGTTNDDYRYTSLHIAAQKGHLKMAHLLLNNKANIEERTARGHTPLYLATHRGDLEMATLLLKNGADIDAPTNDADKFAPLHIAVQNGHSKIVELLLSYKGCANIKTAKGFTPLYIAAQLGYEEIAKLLIQAILANNPVTTKPRFLGKELANFWGKKICSFEKISENRYHIHSPREKEKTHELTTNSCHP